MVVRTSGTRRVSSGKGLLMTIARHIMSEGAECAAAGDRLVGMVSQADGLVVALSEGSDHD
jgi:hypothetical protein